MIPEQYAFFPPLIAGLNGASVVFLIGGRYMISRGRLAAHRACMLAALAASALFLACYIYFHAHAGNIRFLGQGIWRTIYFVILIPHVILAAAIVPLVIITLTRALRENFDRHRAIARWTYPIWVYVSVTGVVVYLMLYQLFVR